MKVLKAVGVLAISAMMLLGAATIAMAYPNHVSLAWVDPNYNNSYDEKTLSGTALYQIKIIASDPDFVGVDSVYIMFEDTVFASSNTIVMFEYSVFASSNVIGSMPVGWSWSQEALTGFATFEVGDATTPLVVGDSLKVLIDYTLVSADVFSDDTAWNEGSAWHQSITTWEIDDTGSHSTSTSPVAPIPEPATALLFGSGIALMGYLKKR